VIFNNIATQKLENSYFQVRYNSEIVANLRLNLIMTLVRFNGNFCRCARRDRETSYNYRTHSRSSCDFCANISEASYYAILESSCKPIKNGCTRDAYRIIFTSPFSYYTHTHTHTHIYIYCI